VDVYTFDDSLVVPPGVTVRKASEIIPRKDVVLHQSGSWALFTDIFRYEGLKRNLGVWMDLDVLLLRDVKGMGDHIYGWQDANVINGAILKLPAESECLGRLRSLSRARVVVDPSWSFKEKAIQRAKGLFGLQVPVGKLRWGTVGPYALTHYVKACHLIHHCQPADVFYPVPFTDATSFFSADAAAIEGQFTSSTRAVHLWNDMIKEAKRRPPPRGSFIAKMCERFDVEPVTEAVR